MESQNLFECPVCLDFFHGGSILQCLDGHVVCENCYNKLPLPRMCVLCTACMPPMSVRNRALEHIAAEVSTLEIFTEHSSTREPAAVDKTALTARKKKMGKAAETVTATAAPVKQNQVVHPGVFCDGYRCNVDARSTYPLKGVRYKCIECENYDLCEVCVKAGVHQQHLFARIADPSTAPMVIKAFNDCRPRQPQMQKPSRDQPPTA